MSLYYYLIPFSLNSFLLLEYTDLPNIPTEQQEIYFLSLIYLNCVHHLALILTQGISRIYREYFSYQVVNRHCPVHGTSTVL